MTHEVSRDRATDGPTVIGGRILTFGQSRRPTCPSGDDSNRSTQASVCTVYCVSHSRLRVAARSNAWVVARVPLGPIGRHLNRVRICHAEARHGRGSSWSRERSGGIERIEFLAASRSHGGLWAPWRVSSSPCLRECPRRSRGTRRRAARCPSWTSRRRSWWTRRGWMAGGPPPAVSRRRRATATATATSRRSSSPWTLACAEKSVDWIT